MQSTALTTRDLPESMTALVEADVPTQTHVLMCAHGVACPSCVMAAARVLIEQDPSLGNRVYTA